MLRQADEEGILLLCHNKQEHQTHSTQTAAGGGRVTHDKLCSLSSVQQLY